MKANLTLTGAVFVVLTMLAPDVAGQGGGHTPAGGQSSTGTGKADGAACNCSSGSPMTMNVPHDSEVTVTITGSAQPPFNENTGYTNGSTAASSSVPPGKCHRVHYTFSCEQDSSGAWDCAIPASFEIKEENCP